MDQKFKVESEFEANLGYQRHFFKKMQKLLLYKLLLKINFDTQLVLRMHLNSYRAHKILANSARICTTIDSVFKEQKRI